MADPNLAIEILAFLIILFVIFSTFITFYVVPWVITTWILLRRAGKPGWASLIPVYQYIVMARVARTRLWIALAAAIIPFVTTLLASVFPTPLINYWLGEAAASTAAQMGYVYLEIATYVADFASLVLLVILAWHFVRQYGRGIWFALLYTFFPVIAVFLLKKMEYHPRS